MLPSRVTPSGGRKDRMAGGSIARDKINGTVIQEKRESVNWEKGLIIKGSLRAKKIVIE